MFQGHLDLAASQVCHVHRCFFPFRNFRSLLSVSLLYPFLRLSLDRILLPPGILLSLATSRDLLYSRRYHIYVGLLLLLLLLLLFRLALRGWVGEIPC